MNKFLLNYFKIIILLIAFSLFGCANTKVNQTTGKNFKGNKIQHATVDLDPYWPSSVDIEADVRKEIFGKSEINPRALENYKKEALENSKLLREITAKGVTSNLTDVFSKYHLKWVSPPEKNPKLKVYVPSVVMRCSLYGICNTYARVRVDLVMPDELRPTWTYFGEFGQPSISGPIDNKIFIAFIESVLSSMENDNVIQK